MVVGNVLCVVAAVAIGLLLCAAPTIGIVAVDKWREYHKFFSADPEGTINASTVTNKYVRLTVLSATFDRGYVRARYAVTQLPGALNPVLFARSPYHVILYDASGTRIVRVKAYAWFADDYRTRGAKLGSVLVPVPNNASRVAIEFHLGGVITTKPMPIGPESPGNGADADRGDPVVGRGDTVDGSF